MSSMSSEPLPYYRSINCFRQTVVIFLFVAPFIVTVYAPIIYRMPTRPGVHVVIVVKKEKKRLFA